jgi:hypothetical protein
MALKIIEEVFIGLKFEISATDFHGDDLFVSQSWRETTAPDSVLCFHGFESFDYQTINGNRPLAKVL